MGLSHIINPRLHIFHNPCDVIFDMCRQVPDVEMSKAAVIIWFLWQHRNATVWEESNATAHQIGLQAVAFWQQWAESNNMFQTMHQPAQHSSTDSSLLQWQSPPNGKLK
jgi:hypothetical protein